MTPECKTLVLGGRKLTAKLLKGGTGEPLLYLHGAIASVGWNPFLNIMAQNYTVYAPFQPGFEEVEGIESLNDIIDLALYYLDLLDEIGIHQTKVVGHFIGAMVAAEMAALCPNSITGIALSAPVGFWHEDTPVRDIFTMNARELREEMWYNPNSPSAKEAIPGKLTDEMELQLPLEQMINLGAAAKFLWPIPDRGLERRIHRITAPVLLVWGDIDRIVPLRYAKDFHGRLKYAETTTIANCGHLPMLECPQDLADEITSFFNRQTIIDSKLQLC